MLQTGFLFLTLTTSTSTWTVEFGGTDPFLFPVDLWKKKRRNMEDGELGVSDNGWLPIGKGGTKKEKALLVRACACHCPLEAKNLIETTFCE